jgi:hypothetical protein
MLRDLVQRIAALKFDGEGVPGRDPFRWDPEQAVKTLSLLIDDAREALTVKFGVTWVNEGGPVAQTGFEFDSSEEAQIVARAGLVLNERLKAEGKRILGVVIDNEFSDSTVPEAVTAAVIETRNDRIEIIFRSDLVEKRESAA